MDFLYNAFFCAGISSDDINSGLLGEMGCPKEELEQKCKENLHGIGEIADVACADLWYLEKITNRIFQSMRAGDLFLFGTQLRAVYLWRTWKKAILR